MARRIVVLALTGAVASAVAVALGRLRRPRGDGRGQAEVQEHRCECGQLFRVAGSGRHRVYWLHDAPESDAVVSGHCPACDRPLPREQSPTTVS